MWFSLFSFLQILNCHANSRLCVKYIVDTRRSMIGHHSKWLIYYAHAFWCLIIKCVEHWTVYRFSPLISTYLPYFIPEKGTKKQQLQQRQVSPMSLNVWSFFSPRKKKFNDTESVVLNFDGFVLNSLSSFLWIILSIVKLRQIIIILEFECW